MIRRGESHVILSRIEVMRKIRKPSTVALLEQLMWLYEEHSRKRLLVDNRCEVTWSIQPDFEKLMMATRKWLQAPIRLDFSGAKTAPDEKERRRQRRLTRKARRREG